jgi:hypothetical protein
MSDGQSPEIIGGGVIAACSIGTSAWLIADNCARGSLLPRQIVQRVCMGAVRDEFR